MKRILIGTVAMIMVMPAFAGDPSGPLLPMGEYFCTVTYECGDGTGASHSYTNSDENNVVITVSENTTCSKPGTTFSHWAVTCPGFATPLSPVAYPGESYDTTGCSDDPGNNFVFTAVYTSDNARTTSKPYVDDQIATRQVKIPAANTSNTNIGNTVITYTNVAGGGVIGERALFTGGEYNASTDADKLITAAALNNTFTNLPTTDTTTLECANPGTCTLWTIVDQTAYGVSGNGTTTIDLSALANTNGTGLCAKNLRGADSAFSGAGCSTPLTNIGDWGVVFPYNDGTVQINGISACSRLVGTENEPASDQSQVQNDYESNIASGPTTSPVGGYCYCKLTDPSTSAARWVFQRRYSSSVCSSTCTPYCARYVKGESPDFQAAVFGVN